MQSSPPNATPLPAPWGYLSTLGWALLAFAISLFVTAAALDLLNLKPPAIPTRQDYDGTTVILTILISTPVQIAVLMLAAYFARWPSAAYLGLVWPGRRETIVGLAAAVMLVVVFDVLFLIFGENVVSDFQIDLYRDAHADGLLIWLFFTVAVAAPAGEEILFRGFLFRGWAKTRESAPYAIVAVALLWSSMHIQYNWLGIFQVFMAGLLLGWMRWLTGSTLLTIAMHVTINFIAMIETALRFEWMREGI